MGCDQCRERCPDEELLLRDRQALLRLYTLKTKTLYETFTTVARGETVNDKGFNDAVERLHLPVTSNAYTGLIERFYAKLQSNGSIPLRKLQLLSVLLGTGLPQEKAVLLFQSYDLGYTLKLSEETVRRIVSELMEIAVDLVGVLSENPGQVNMPRYFGELKAAKEEFLEARVGNIIGEKEEIQREEFVQVMSGNVECRNLLQAGTLRMALYGLRKEQLIKRRARVPPGLTLTAIAQN